MSDAIRLAFLRLRRRVPDWVWLVGLAAVLRLINLGAENLWYDEAFTAFLTKLPLRQLWPAILGDDHPPLWYGLEWITVRLLGNSEAALRLPAALLGIVAVYLMWRLALHLTDDWRVAFVAGLILAVLPSALYYSQEARMYSLLLVCALWALDSLIRTRYWQFALACIGLLYAHNVGVLYVAVLVTAKAALIVWRYCTCPRTILRPWPRVVLPWLLALGGIALAWLPWAIVGVIPQMHAVGGSFWMPPLQVGDAIYPWLGMWMGVRAADALETPLYLGGLLAVEVGLIVSRHWLIGSYRGKLLLALLFGLPLLDAAISLLWRNIYLHRTLLPSVALLAIPVAYALVRLQGTDGRMLRLVFAASLAIGLIAHYFPDGTRGRTDTVAWVAPIMVGWQPGDAIYHLSLDSAVGTDYYTPGKPVFILPEAGDLAQSLSDQTKSAMGMVSRTLDQLQAEGYRRVWMLFNNSPMTSRAELGAWRQIVAFYPNHVIRWDTPPGGLAQSYIYLVLLKADR